MNAPSAARTRPGARTRRRRPQLRDLLTWKMRTYDLYVARCFLLSYVVCAVSFTGLFVSIEAFAKLDRFLKQDQPLFATLWRYHTAMVPTVWTHYIGPVLTAAAGMFTITLLNRQNELTAIKAAGASTYRVLVPIFAIAALLTGATFWMQESVLPEHRAAIRTALAISKGRPLRPDKFYDATEGISIRAEEYSTTRRVASGVQVLYRHPNLAIKTKIAARRMEWVPGEGTGGTEGHWELHQGSVQRWDENGSLSVNADREGFERLKTFFDRRKLRTTMRPIDLETSDLDIAYLSWSELKTQFQRQPYHRHLAVKLHLHFAFPLAHVLLLLLALPVVLNFENRSIIVGIGISVLIGAAFYFLSSICMSIAQDSVYFSPILAAWLPVMLFGALGITLFDHLPT